MRPAAYIFCEALTSLYENRRRLLPMALGIVWGMASVMVLLAIASGFERSQREALGAYGDRFLLLRLNRAELDRAAGGRERRLMMDPLDIERLRQGAPAIRRLSPLNNAYRARITARHGAGSHVIVSGALPELAELRNLPLAEGRFYNELEEEHRRRVIVLGPQARRQLFGRRPALGQKVRVAGFSSSDVPQRVVAPDPSEGSRRGSRGSGLASPPPPPGPAANSLGDEGARDVQINGELFEVIGVMADNEVQRESYVSVARMAFIPFFTSCAVFDRKYNIIVIEPREIAERDLAVEQFRHVMGARYGFGPEDKNAVLVYFDAIGRAERIGTIFGGLRLFLSLVGISILAIGAVGVMNVVLVSVAARRFEIGLRKAVGATPRLIYCGFFVETVLGCLLSGVLGFALGALGIWLLGVVTLPEGFSRPQLDFSTATLASSLLGGVAVVVAVYPARKAARLPPVEALREHG